MSDRAGSLDRLAGRLLVEARVLDGVADTIEPLIGRVRGAWEGPAADRLVSELAERRRELGTLAAGLRSLAQRYSEDARRIRAAQVAALAPANPDPIPGAGGISSW